MDTEAIPVSNYQDEESAWFNPLVSIIIPCYNLDGYLENSLNSCVLQTYKNLEFIVVDDGSTDGTGKTIDYYASVDKRFIPLHLKNGGVAIARRVAIAKSTGTYFFFLDGDDSIPLDTIERLVKAAYESGADIVVGNFMTEREQGFQSLENPLTGTIQPLGFMKRLILERDFSLGGKLYARKLITNDLDYHLYLKRGEDALVSMQLVNKANFIFGIPVVAYYYRNRLASISRTTNPETSYYHQVFEARFKIEEYAIKCGIDKTRDFELDEFMCFTLVIYLTNTDRIKLDSRLIKSKIKDYLVSNPAFREYYKTKFKKNFYRLYLYYYLSLPGKLFDLFFRIFEKIL